jgi:hypothetical protein
LHPEKYSCVRYLGVSGYATLIYDRVGTGASSLPQVYLVTGGYQACIIHQLIQQIGSGELGSNKFDKIVLIGHSKRSPIVLLEGILYHDVDAVTISGLLNFNSFVGPAVNELLVNWVSASEDIKFKDIIPAGYTTTRTDTRGNYFYNIETADKETIIKDKELKSLATIFGA